MKTSALTLILQEGFNLTVGSAKVEYESVLFALKNQPQIKSAAAFHEGPNSS
jgi:hypothetical protein